MAGYFAYIRVSTVRQGEHGTSLSEQRNAIEAYARRHNLTVAAWFEEMQTAAKQGRLQFTRMLAEVKRGKAKGVIFYKIDRGARNLKDWAEIGDLLDAGVDVHVAHESLDLSTRGGRLTADLLAVIAADFLRNQRQDIRTAVQARFKQGLFPLPAPRGYLDQGKGKPKTIDPVLGPLVREAFELYASGTHTFETLRNERYTHGLRAKSGKPLSLESVSKMLRNPFYIGLIRAKDGRTFQGIHEPLVPKATFDRVQAMMHGRVFARPQRHDHAFRRMIHCAGCGHVLTGELQKGHTYYRCHARGCTGTSLRERDIDAAIQNQLARFAFTDEEFGDFKDLAAQALAEELGAQENRRAVLARDLARCEERLARLTDAFLDGVIDKPTFELRNSSLIEERLSLREALETPAAEGVPDRVLGKLDYLRTHALGYDLASPHEKRDIIRELAATLVAQGNSLDISLRDEFRPFVKSNRNTNDGG